MAVNPYLTFPGTCRDAFTFYQGVFGGELSLMGFDQLPPGEVAPPHSDGLLMHASLIWGEGDTILGADEPNGKGNVGGGASVSYTVNHTDEAERVFLALAPGGQIVMPMQQTFWSPGFGILLDQYGVSWMINVAQ